MERRPGEGRSRELVLLLLAALVLVIGIGILFLARHFGGGDVHKGGPLARPAESRDAVAVPVDLKAPYWWGLIYLRNKGDEPAQVEALDLGQIPAGMRVLPMRPKPELVRRVSGRAILRARVSQSRILSFPPGLSTRLLSAWRRRRRGGT
jgi:hypothetical protein